jgi:membrane protein YqaA with SNARE-associated domain
MTDWTLEASLGALFASAFLSATILPGNSELVLVKVLLDRPATSLRRSRSRPSETRSVP